MTVVAVSTVGWILRGALALAFAVFIYVVGAGILRKFKVEPQDEVDPTAVVPVNIRYQCIVCGAEVVMTSAQEGGDGEEPDAPRHCREDMIRVEEPA